MTQLEILLSCSEQCGDDMVTAFTNNIFHYNHVPVNLYTGMEDAFGSITLHHQPIHEAVKVSWSVKGNEIYSQIKRLPLQYTVSTGKARFLMNSIAQRCEHQANIIQWTTNILNELTNSNAFLHNFCVLYPTNKVVTSLNFMNNGLCLEIYSLFLPDEFALWSANWFQQCTVLGSQKIFPTADAIEFIPQIRNLQLNCFDLITSNKNLIQNYLGLFREDTWAIERLNLLDKRHDLLFERLKASKSFFEFSQNTFILPA